jgi:hypothetical protein
MTPVMQRVTKLNIGPLQEILKGCPAVILNEIGKQLASDQGRRIRNEGLTYDGDVLSENSPGYRAKKEVQYGETRTGVASGAMTEPDAWDPKVGNNRVLITLDAEHHQKQDNMIGISQKTGKNYDRMFGVGAFEQEQIMAMLKFWLKRLGVEVK